jgi:hypothetical protein
MDRGRHLHAPAFRHVRIITTVLSIREIVYQYEQLFEGRREKKIVDVGQNEKSLKKILPFGDSSGGQDACQIENASGISFPVPRHKVYPRENALRIALILLWSDPESSCRSSHYLLRA